MDNNEIHNFLVDALFECYSQTATKINRVAPVDTQNSNYDIRSSNADLIITHPQWIRNAILITVLKNDSELENLDMAYYHQIFKEKQIIPIAMVGSIWCLDTKLPDNYINGASYVTMFNPHSLLPIKNRPLINEMSQNSLVKLIQKAWNTLDSSVIEPYLDINMHYSSAYVFHEMSSSYEYITYLRSKFKRISESNSIIETKIAINSQTGEPALLIRQPQVFEGTLIIHIKAKAGRITEISLKEINI